MKIIQAKGYQEMSRIAANIVSAQIILFPRSVLGLATGDTPIGMYRQLIEWHRKGDLDFSQVRTVNLDEYVGLSKEHEQSYNWFMRRHLFSQINLPPRNTFLPDGLAEDTAAECRHYEEIIRTLGGVDLQVLGIGHNGHIGFNEPGPVFTKNTHAVTLTERTLTANSRFFDSGESMPRQAITMGMGTIMQAKRIVLLCAGEAKSEILQSALLGDIDPMVPASILQLHTDVTIAADEAALGRMDLEKLAASGIEVVTERD